MRGDGLRFFRPGEVVYFHHLHTRHDLVKHDPHPDADGRSWCRVEGKPRPMLILRRCRRLLVDTARSTDQPSGTNQCVWYRVETRTGYWVLSLTSKAPPGLHGHYPNLVEHGKDSFVGLEPLCYPAESVCHGPSQPVRTVDDRVFGMIEKAAGLSALGCSHYRA
jgi:hypothetical protein